MVRSGSAVLVGCLALSALVGCGGKSLTRTVTSVPPTTTTTTTVRTAPPRTTTGTGAQTASTPTASAPAGGKCAPIDLGIHFVGTLGAAGSLFSRFEFINVSAHTCGLYGYPGMAAYTRTGQPVTLAIRRDPTHGPHEVLLAPRHGSDFTVRTFSNAAGACVTAYRLRFIPPNDYGTLEIAHSLTICGAGATITAVGSSG
jgi:hypothetical protein